MGARIAILEDDQPIREMYELKLKSAGYTVKAAGDGVQGLTLLEKFRPDLILLDLMMPEMNGDEVAEKVRSTKWGSKTKIIVLTNISLDEAPEKLQKLGILDYVVKANHTPSQVIQIVQNALH